MMSEPSHDLYDFFKKANDEIENEYIRISKRVKEDPGTAGDQGEENWKEIIESWIPPYFQVVTKGRIIGTNGVTSPQVDIIVLSPDYPSKLLNCKEYLAGGVVAAFECKITLRRKHIEEFMKHSKEIKSLASSEQGTPRRDLQSKIYYGLLAHSHEWKAESSKPKDNITKAVYEFDKDIINHPKEMPDIICVSDVGVWKSCKAIIPSIPNASVSIPTDCVTSSYIVSDSANEFYTPVGGFIFDFLCNISWKYTSIRDIADYMRKLHIVNTGSGQMRQWNKNDVLSVNTISNFNKLINGGLWDEWGMVVF